MTARPDYDRLDHWVDDHFDDQVRLLKQVMEAARVDTKRWAPPGIRCPRATARSPAPCC